jgi:hypothetical protein
MARVVGKVVTATKIYFDSTYFVPTLAGSIGGAPEGTAVKSTGEAGGTKFLREDGDGTCSWQTPAGGHTQNTDTGTTGNTFTVDSDSTTGKIIVDVALGAADLSLTLTNEALTTSSKTITFPNANGTVSFLALGETSTTAYRGDRGKTAYDHSQVAHAPDNADNTYSAINGASSQNNLGDDQKIATVNENAEIIEIITYANLRDQLKSYFDSIYTPL